VPFSANLFQALCAEFFPATCATGVQDLATGFGGHPRAKAVTPFAYQVRGLKGAFHRSVSNF
jgi:hypothetical protein